MPYPAEGPNRIFLTATGTNTWTVPMDWNSSANTIEVIGAGGGGASTRATTPTATGGGGGSTTGNGGNGAQGAIFISYLISATNPGNFFLMFR